LGQLPPLTYLPSIRRDLVAAPNTQHSAANCYPTAFAATAADGCNAAKIVVKKTGKVENGKISENSCQGPM
jgi:hypothetical protein